MLELISEAEKEFSRIADLTAKHKLLNIEGLWGASAPFSAANIVRLLNKKFIYITGHIDLADKIQEDLEQFYPNSVEVFPCWEADRPDILTGDEIAAERLRILVRMLSAENKISGLVLPIQSMIFPVPSRDMLSSHSRILHIGQQLRTDEIAEWLVEHGFSRLEQIEQPGDFSIRGGIIDIYPSGVGFPIRCELFDDEIESIRRIDPTSQRSLETMTEFMLYALPEFFDKQTHCSLAEYLDEDTIIFWHEPMEIFELADVFLSRLNNPIGLYPSQTIIKQLEPFNRISLSRIYCDVPGERVKMDFHQLPKFDFKPEIAIKQLLSLSTELKKTYLFCENIAERERLAELLEEENSHWQRYISLRDGLISRGFVWASQDIAFVSNAELFHRYEFRHRLKKRTVVRATENFAELEPGDYVVHVNYGIGKFEGLKTIKQDGQQKEFMVIRYAENSLINVPAHQLNLVQKYVGGFRGHPPLTKLSGKSWTRTKQRVADAVSELAREMLEIQAKRISVGGIQFREDTAWQRQLEESFIYQETEDQILAMRDIKRDMERGIAMDRLLCGDVGYGKTELAIRAAFKAVESGYQVAVLVPTTILAEQHYRTFRQRLAEFPIEVDFLSRFKKRSQQSQTIERASAGQIDILIGTHRLLSRDVRFHNLGLVIVDEEQRFGVAHKERLKQMRSSVDVLTLTATPIPRTLHLSLIGLRDISTLASPPLDRRAIQTEIRKFDWQLIRQAILRELNRDGQVFFVHNYVHNIEQLAEKIRERVPEARVIVAHGQMPERKLEDVMLKFINREADVLVCTTIIESGVDIPTVNTLFINNADRFGLAELHQLRGRVGRYKYHAYAYLLVPDNRPITPLAARRLRAIEEYSELGAGFRIAMRDLEIRGAGNILGPEQSGHIAAVGYELYCQLLSNAVKQIQSNQPVILEKANIDLPFSSYIPKSYISSERQRLQVYRQLARVQSISECNQLESDLADIFGKIPDSVKLMLDAERVRILAGLCHIKFIRLYDGDLIFHLANPKECEQLFADCPIEPRFAKPDEIHIRIPTKQQTPRKIIEFLFKLLNLSGTA